MLKTKLGKLALPNPVTVASGTFSLEYKNFYDLNKLGAIITKTITPEPKIGNPPPRIYETKAGLLNSIGLQNPGLESFITNDLKQYQGFSNPIIISFSASKISDFIMVLKRLEENIIIDGYEVNISCPNVENEGLAFGTDEKIVYQLTSQLAKVTSKELILKLSPNVTDLTLIARAAEDGGATSISLINTLWGMAIDWKTGKSFIRQGIAGYSGPAIKPIALAATYKVAKAVNIPIIAMGGISCMEDVLEFIYAGASAVAIGTSMFSNPLLPIEIINNLDNYCKINKKSIRELKGKVNF